MGCLRLDPNYNKPVLKVAYRNPLLSQKVVQKFLSVDPRADKYPGWSPYNYVLNNPLSNVDFKGDTVSPIISGPSYYPNRSNSVAGHVALNVDGTVYSFEGDGKWKTYKYEDYMKNEKKDRHVAEITLNVDQTEVQNALDHRKDGQYDIEKNSCVTQCMSILSEGGINFNKPNGAVTPDQLGEALNKSAYKERTQMYQPNFDRSFTGRLAYSIVTALGLEKYLSGSKVNTNELIKKGTDEKN
jgi:hypothetical protein